MSIPVLGIPVLNQAWQVAALVKSIDFAIQHLVFVHNRVHGENSSEIEVAMATQNDWVKKRTVHTFDNVGVSGAWNAIIFRHPAPYWLIVNQDILFLPDSLKKIHKWSSLKDTDYLLKFRAYSAFCIKNKTVQRFGSFDENFWPSYAEDCDYSKRLNAAGVQETDYDVGLEHVGGSSLRSVRHRSNHDILMRKWGTRICNGNVYKKIAPNDWKMDWRRRKRRGGVFECVMCS